jgi:hypothetical protein
MDSEKKSRPRKSRREGSAGAKEAQRSGTWDGVGRAVVEGLHDGGALDGYSPQGIPARG